MMKLQRVLLILLVLGGLVIFTLENWSPSVPLVIFSTKTIALPLSLWILAACLAGALTTVAIALCLRLLIHESYRPTKEDVQSFGSPMPQSPRQTTRRPNAESTQYDSASQSFTSRFNPLWFTRQFSGAERSQRSSGSSKSQQSSSQQPPSKRKTANKAVVDVGMEDWEEFSRPREDWDDWQRSNFVGTEVDLDQPISSGSRFEKSSGDTIRSAQASRSEGSTSQPDAEFYERDRPRAYERRGYDAQGYDDGRYEQREEGQRDDRRDRDRYGYSYDDDPQNSYDAYYGGADRYPQDSPARYDPSGDMPDDYSSVDYDQGRYDQDRYDQNPYEPKGYAQEPYGYDKPYGRTGRDSDHSQSNPAPPPDPNRDPNGEQYIMDYGDEAALDAFDAELETRSTSRAKTGPGNDVSSQTGRYRWKNPFNTQSQTPQNSTLDDDLDLSSLDDWDE